MAPASENAALPQLDHTELERLHAFHTVHFPSQEVPTSLANELVVPEDRSVDPEQSEDLGYYEDGVRRTLTDEQIRMFRHSEIQRKLLARRQQREKEDEETQKAHRVKNRTLNQKRRFDDEPIHDDPPVDTLMYDDAPANKSKLSMPAEKKFLWPTFEK